MTQIASIRGLSLRSSVFLLLPLQVALGLQIVVAGLLGLASTFSR